MRTSLQVVDPLDGFVIETVDVDTEIAEKLAADPTAAAALFNLEAVLVKTRAARRLAAPEKGERATLARPPTIDARIAALEQRIAALETAKGVR